MDFIKDNDELTIDPSAIRVRAHEDVTSDRDRIMTSIDSSNITIIKREVLNTLDNEIIDVSAAHFRIGLDGIDVSYNKKDEYSILKTNDVLNKNFGVVMDTSNNWQNYLRDSYDYTKWTITASQGKVNNGTTSVVFNWDSDKIHHISTTGLHDWIFVSAIPSDTTNYAIAKITILDNEGYIQQPGDSGTILITDYVSATDYNTLWTGRTSLNADSNDNPYYQIEQLQITRTDISKNTTFINSYNTNRLCLGASLDDTNKSNHLTIIPNGDACKVGIGTDTPDAQLHILVNGTPSASGASRNNPLTLKMEQIGWYDYNQIFFAQSNNGYGSFIGHYELENGSYNNYFFIDGIYNNVRKELLRINSYSGNVGVGTTTPEALLHIKGPYDHPNNIINRAAIIMETSRSDNPDPNQNTYKYEFKIRDDTTGMPLHIGPGTAFEGINISHDGNVGIGTTPDPSYPLYVRDEMEVGSTGPSSILRLRSYFSTARSDSVLIHTHSNNMSSGRDTLKFQMNGSGKMFLTSEGNLGIGTQNPGYRLEVNGGAQDVNFYNSYGGSRTYWYANTGIKTIGSGQTSEPIIAKFNSGIWVSNHSFNTSDMRIKKDISDADISDCLNKVNQIQLKMYNYKDPKRYVGQQKTHGFIAQQVYSVYPRAINIQQEAIPDVMEKIENIEWITNNDGTFSFLYELVLEDNNTGECLFYVSDTQHEEEPIIKKYNNGRFTFDKQWKYVFLYGKYINDLHTVDKNAIFQLHHGAIQQMYNESTRLNTEKTAQIEALQQETAALQQDNADLRAQLQQIKTHLGLS